MATYLNPLTLSLSKGERTPAGYCETAAGVLPGAVAESCLLLPAPSLTCRSAANASSRWGNPANRPSERTATLRVSAQSPGLMLLDTIFKIVGVCTVVGRISALQYVAPEHHRRRLLQMVVPLPVRAHPSTGSG